MRKTLQKGFKWLMVTGMIAGTLAALLPMAPASAGTRAWSTATLPGTTGSVLRNGAITMMAVSPDFATDNTIFAVIDSVTAGTADNVVKSTNGGRTWGTPVDVTSADAVNITSISISPQYASDSTLVVTDATRVFRSTNGGTSYGQLGAAVGAGVTVLTASAISPTYNGTGEIAVGLANNNGTNPADAVLVWGRSGTLNWQSATTNAAKLAEGVSSLAYSPSYAADATMIAVSTATATSTRLHTLVGTSSPWDGVGGPVTIAAGINSLNADPAGASGLRQISSTALAVPGDFDSSNTSKRLVFVGLNTVEATGAGAPAEIGGFYRAGVISGTSSSNLLATPTDVTSLSLTGDNTANGTLFVGLAGNAVRYSTNHFGTVANITTTAATTNPVPGTAPGVPANAAGATVVTKTLVATASTFSTTGMVFAAVGSLGSGAGAQTGFSVSTDSGVNFSQISMVNDQALVTAVVNNFAGAGAGRISDLAITGSTIYLSVVGDDAGGVLADSLWLSNDLGATWNRVDTMDVGGGAPELALIGLSPTYATDGVAYWADGGTATGIVRRSTNSGKSWGNVSAPLTVGTITALNVLDGNSLMVGSSLGAVRRSINRGFIWSGATITAPTAPITSIARSPSYATDTKVLVGDGGGQVFLSSNGGSSFTVLNSTLIGAPVASLAVAFDGATAGVYYAASNVAATGINRWVDSVSTTSFTAIDTTGTPAQAEPPTAGALGYANDVIVSGPDGTLYATDTTAGSALRRSANPTARTGAQIDNSSTPVFTSANNTSATGTIAGGTTTGPIAWAAGSNIIYAVRTDLTPDTLITYSDTFSNPMVAPTLTSPINDLQVGIVAAGGSTVSVGSITFTWANVTGANAYQVQVAVDSAFQTPIAGENQVVAASSTDSTSALNLTALGANTRYYWRIRAILDSTGVLALAATNDLLTRFSTPGTFIAGAGAAGVSIPALTTPVLGNIGYTDQPAQPTFVWTAVTGATAYELQVGTDGTFTTPTATVVDRTEANRLGNQLAYQDASVQLQPGTTYFWRVRAIVGTGTSAITGAWSPASAFRTVAGTVGQAGTPETVLATLQAAGNLELVSSFNYTSGVYEAYVPNLPGNKLAAISPNSVLFITVTKDTTVVVSGVEFKIKANTPTPIPVGSAVTVTVKA